MPNVASSAGTLGLFAGLAVFAAIAVALFVNTDARSGLATLSRQIRSLPAVRFLWGPPPEEPTTSPVESETAEPDKEKVDDNFDYEIFRYYNDTE